MNNSLKVQHSQASPNRCCQSILSSSQTSENSQKSQTSQSSTLTGSCGGRTQISSIDQNSSHQKQPLMNGIHHCDDNSSSPASPTKDDRRSLISSSASNIPCNCKCDPKDFQNTLRSSQELRKETCKLVNSVTELQISKSPNILRKSGSDVNHRNCKCSCTNDNHEISPPKVQSTLTKPILTNGDSATDIDDWSLMLIGLAQIHPTTSLVHMDPFDALPTISVVPPTPEGIFTKFSTPLSWESTKFSLDELKQSRGEVINDFSPEDSPQDEEPPYRSLNTSLKR